MRKFKLTHTSDPTKDCTLEAHEMWFDDGGIIFLRKCDNKYSLLLQTANYYVFAIFPVGEFYVVECGGES